MQQQEASLSKQLLPRVRGRRTEAVGTKTQFYSNMYKLSLKNCRTSIYQYVVEVTPAIGNDSTQLLGRIIGSLKGQLRKELGEHRQQGFMLWARKNSNKVLSLTSEFTRNDKPFRYEVLIKPTNELNIVDLAYKNADEIAALCQMLNIDVKCRLRGDADKRTMVELDRGVFFRRSEVGDNEERGVGLSVWRGLRATVIPNNGQLYLQVDAVSKVLSLDNFLKVLKMERKNISLQDINGKYTGSTVLNKKGNMRVYHIDGIDFDMNPRHKFTDNQAGKEISYIEYYMQKYGYKVEDEKQPMVRVKVRAKKTQKEEGPKLIYLIPEMLVLTGMSESQKQDRRIMKQLDTHTKLRPQERMDESQSIIRQLCQDKDSFFEISQVPEKINGMILEAPYVRVGKGKTVDIVKGSINLRHIIYDPYKFHDWMFVYSIGRNPDDDQDDADFAFEHLKKASQTYGIGYNEPKWVEIDAKNYGDWEAELTAEKKRMKNPPAFVVYYLKPFEKNYYDRLKMLNLELFGCPSQVVHKRILSPDNKKGVMSCASKIALQMNAKMGHPIWLIDNKHKFWHTTGQRVAVGSIAMSKSKQGSAISFVGTIDNKLINYVNAGDMFASRAELSSAFYEKLFIKWVKEYYDYNGKSFLPNVIVIYREGLNDVQARSAFEMEIDGLNSALETIRKKSKIEDYSPKITYVLVNKKSNERMFERGKEYLNPEAGSIVFEDLSRDSFKEFHLASVQVNLGSCTPVSFKVGSETYDTPMDALAEMTYNQCYGYWNWQGPVRVPATLQYANKLGKALASNGKRFAEHMKSGNLKNKLFYL